jgi:purine nucleosidase
MLKKLSLLTLLLTLAGIVHAAAPATVAGKEKVIFDTDIGDDIDDAYALSFLLRSPEVQLLGVTTAFKDTHLRARLVTRLLKVAGRSDVPVYEGPKTADDSGFTQKQWAEGSPDRAYPDAIKFTLNAIRNNPGQITLISVAPLTNVGALIAKDPTTFRKLKRVVIMGGSIDRGYGTKLHADAEWNIVNDIPGAKALFESGVPLYVMPLDSTQIPLDPAHQQALFGKRSELTAALEELTKEWSTATNQKLPTLFDVVAAVYAVNAMICPTTAMKIEVDDKGFTRRETGTPNAQVCLKSAAAPVLDLFLPRVF